MRRHIPIYIVLIVVLALFSSCTVTEQMTIGKNSGQIDSDIDIEKYFIEVLEDLSEFMPESDESVMDSAISTFSGQLAESGHATDIAFVKDGENDYVGSFTFDSFSALVNAMNKEKGQSVIKETANSLTFYVDMDNYTELEQIVPFLADPNIEVYLAKYNVGYSEEDYLEMLVFSLGEEAPDSVMKSNITLNVTVPGSITKLEGAEKTGNSSFRYTFRLIDFLLLQKPLSFSVEWK